MPPVHAHHPHPHPHPHPLLNLSLAARHQLIGREQQLVAHIKSRYHAVRVALEPHVNALIAAYGAELTRRQQQQRQQAADGEDGETPAPPRVTVPRSWLAARGGGNVKPLQAALRQHLGTFAGAATGATMAAQGAAIQAATEQTRHSVTVALSPAIRRGLPPDTVKTARQSALDALAGRAKNGKPLSWLYDQLPQDTAQAVYDILAQGLADGTGPRALAGDIWRAIGGAQYRALTIARTELLGAYRAATALNYQANSDTLDGWYWQAALDGRVCGMCAAMHGTFHTLDETLDSHAQCRCAMVPKTKSYADILGPLGIDTSDIPETGVSDSDFQDGAAWLAQQDAATQRDVLGGQAAYNAYQQGAFTLADLIGTASSAAWGDSRYQKSLKQLGINFQDYLST